MSILSDLFSRHSYPQYVFAHEVNKCIKRSESAEGYYVDAPCGNGLTTYLLAKENPSKSFKGFDIESEQIESIPALYKRENVMFQTKEIHAVLEEANYPIAAFIVINSLFLLPDNPGLVKKVAAKLGADGRFILVIPNIYGKNYRSFMKTRYSHINIYEYTPASLIGFVTGFGFQHVQTKPLVYTHFYGRRELRLFGRLSTFYLGVRNMIETLLKIGEPNYWLVELKKNSVTLPSVACVN